MSNSDQASWKQRIDPWGPIIVLAGLIAYIPYVLIYLKNLWLQPHYQFFPMLLAVVGVLVYQRCSSRLRFSELTDGEWRQALLSILFMSALVAGFFATLFASVWMGYLGFTCMLASWLASRKDVDTDGSLLSLTVPVALIWQPPYNTVQTADTILIQSLQVISARLSSKMLDSLGILHAQPGTVLEVPGKCFGIAEACSGIQSFFAVLAIASLIIVYFRRNLLHAGLLLISVPVWSVMMNTIRITIIPIAYTQLGIDLSHGLLHDLLGYTTMILAALLLLSADQLIDGFFKANFGSMGRSLRRLSNRVVAPLGWLMKKLTSTERPMLKKIASVCVLLFFGVVFVLQGQDSWASWSVQRKAINFFRDKSLVELSRNDMPVALGDWPLAAYDRQERGAVNDDLGERSDTWRYATPFGTAVVALDQRFPSWHELTRCYRNAGWSVKSRVVLSSSPFDAWPVVCVDLTRRNEVGYLIFSLVTQESKPLTPPGAYTYWTILEERLRGRLTPAVRQALFGTSAYQIQCFVASSRELAEEHKLLLRERYLTVRGQLWNAANRVMQMDAESN